MRHTVHLQLDDLGPALTAAAELLDSTALRLESLQISTAAPGKARLTAVLVGPSGSPGLERLRGLGSIAESGPKPPVRLTEPSAVPYHWQADGAR